MTIEIKITDPHLMDWEALHKTAIYLLSMIGEKMPNNPLLQAAANRGNDLSKPLMQPSVVPENQPSYPQEVPFNFTGQAVPTISPPNVPPPMPCATLLDSASTFNNLGTRSEIDVDPKEIVDSHAISDEIDSRGLPWDQRINMKSKIKDKAGNWRYQKSASKSLIKFVEDELKQVMNIKANEPAEYVEPGEEITFPALMLKITKAVTNGLTTHAAVIDLVKAEGLPNIPLLGTRPDLIPVIYRKFKEMIGEK